MVKAYTRPEVLSRLKKTLDDGKPILASGAGTGISAVAAEKGGIDLIVIYNSGKYRMGGRASVAGLLAYGDANAITLELAAEVIPVVKTTPVIAGVCGSDPFRLMDLYLSDLKKWRFSGVQNFPTYGVVDGVFRSYLEETGLGFGREVEMIATAHNLDLFTMPFVFNADESRRMVEIGADMVVAHMGLTTKGLVGAKTSMTLDDAAERTQQIADAARAVNPNVLVLTHGGPIAEVDDFAYVLEKTRGIHGFAGATTFERLPVEKAIPESVKAFKNLALK
ncbi:MAG: phosphoenolpyruvate hydrolase family protein [Candidatus Bathyarchaeia archaeon]